MSRISTFTSQIVVIVDAASSGVYLAPAFLAAGYRCVHVTNTLEAFPGPSPVPVDYFEENISFEGDLPGLLTRLERYRVAHIVAGSEPGVELADQLSFALGLATSNGIAHSAARREKYVMQEALREAGVPHAKTCLVGSAGDVVAWADSCAGWPVVVKPPRSAGTDRVRVCRDEAEVRCACEAIAGKKNMLGVANAGILAQKFLQGEEFMVNSVSARGEHRVLEIWRSHKAMADGVPLYDHLDLVCSRESDYAPLAAYTARVLDALGIRHGAAHTELMLSGTEPILIECAARLQGNINPAALFRVTGSNQILDSVASYISPDHFLDRTRTLQALGERCKIVILISPKSGFLEKPLAIEKLQALTSFHSLRLRQGSKAGTAITKSSDLLTTVGSVYLVHEDADRLDQDYRAIRRLEADGFYDDVIDG